MRLLTPLCTVLLTIAFCSCAAHAQDSPIYINDNGNIPLEGQKRKPPSKAKKRPKDAKAGPWSFTETHIHHANGIRYENNEYFIELTGYKAVCLEYPNGNKTYFKDGAPWRLTTLSSKDNTTISSGNGNNHIHIDPGATMSYNGPDMDDPDPNDIQRGTKNQMIGAVFNGATLSYPTNTSFIIHYCGPDKDCLGGKDGKTPQCPDPNKLEKK